MRGDYEVTVLLRIELPLIRSLSVTTGGRKYRCATGLALACRLSLGFTEDGFVLEEGQVSPQVGPEAALIRGWSVSMLGFGYAQKRERDRHQYHNHAGDED